MANSRNNYLEDLWSSDDSDDDQYNYLKALDNINWNKSSRQGSGLSPTSTNRPNVAKSWSRSASKLKPVAKPAVAVKIKSNRNDFLLKDMIASKKDKTKDIPKNENNSESVVNNKRDSHVMEDLEDVDDIVISNDSNSKTNDNNIDKRSDSNYFIPKTKRFKPNDFVGSDYQLKDVLNQKKAIHEKSVKNNIKSDLNRVKSERVFGKAFSPTVYSPEVPVMKSVSVPQTSNLNILQKALTFNEENVANDSKYNPNAILSIILDWNTKWLTEFNESEVPNLLSPFGEGIGLKTCYESLEEYQSAYIPLILFETWAQIHKDFTNEKQIRFEAVRGPEMNADQHFITINFQTVVNKNKLKDYPTEGYLLILELTIDYGASNEKRKVVFFGYVVDFNTERITSNTTLLPNLAVPPSSGNYQLLKYFVVLSKKPIRLSQNQSIKVQAVHYLKPTMRQIELISHLNTSPLFKDILKPRSFTCQVVVPTNISLSCPNFNESQHRAILGSYEALIRPYAVPKVLFIQGPPGTGKTHTLIGIIKHIYKNWDLTERLPRILICAPSNGAVDEISRRLYRERHFLSKHRIEKHRRALRCVRIGKESQVHIEVRKILFEQLIKDNTNNEVKRLNEEKEKKTKELDERIKKLDQEMANLRVSKNKNELTRAEKEMSSLMFEYQKVSSDASKQEKSEKGSKGRLRMDIICKADVVLSTLNSCHSSPIESLYKIYGPQTFDCVIVDEASQCSEPELLMPLAYKMTKMILIGDPMQLPATVISKKASGLQMGRSLFERFFDYFRQCERTDPNAKSPILMLTEQYRMHPQICQFPSNYFYDGRLTSSPKLVKSRQFKLKPYIVFDVTDTVENKSNPTNKYNELEANFVFRLVSLINDMLDSNPDNSHKYSVGIITPYNGQKKYLNNKFTDKEYKNVFVEVNTVDGFQGQERDIIILSAVRAFDSNNSNKWQSIGFLDSKQRMNVALTRAKYSMILCISARSLETNKHWKELVEDTIRRANTRFKVSSTLGSEIIKKMLGPIETINIAD